MANVIVIGGGVAGLTAAHELAARGYKVTVLEASSLKDRGGKCRSQFFTEPGLGDLAGEHGFRFFPGFYWHVPDMMKRIPSGKVPAVTSDAGLKEQEDNVAEHLVASPRMGIAFPARPVATVPMHRATMGKAIDMGRFLWDMLGPFGTRAAMRLGKAYLRFLFSCDARRLDNDNDSFWNYIEADNMSADAQRLLINLPRQLVAMDAKQGSARTLLNTLFLMTTEWSGVNSAHRVLDGPTSAVWINPWIEWLEKLTVRFQFDTRVDKLVIDPKTRKITHVEAQGGASFSADHYVLAVPLEPALRLLQPLRDALKQGGTPSKTLDRFVDLDPERALGHMVGAQLFLNRPLKLPKGHTGFAESPWAVTAVPQDRYWTPQRLADYNCGGKVQGIVSAIVCGWDREKGQVTKRMMNEATPEDVRAELVAQIGCCNDDEGEPLLESKDILACHVDEEVKFNAGGGVKENRGRLLIHPPGFYERRPPSVIEDLPNLVLASDWVKSVIDLATMEGATETARKAVNGILERDRVRDRCATIDHFAMHEPAWLKEKRLGDVKPFAKKVAVRFLDDDKEDAKSEKDLIERLETFEIRIGKELSIYG